MIGPFPLPCPTCGATEPGQHDPFAEELAAHGLEARPFDNSNRDEVRAWAELGCERCRDLAEAFDAAFAAHLFG